MHLDWILASDSFFGKRDSFFDNCLPKKESLQSKFSTRKTVATKTYIGNLPKKESCKKFTEKRITRPQPEKKFNFNFTDI